MINSKLRNFDPSRVVRNRLEACERRNKLALTLRDALAARLGDSSSDPIVSALIDSVVSAHLEISETTTRFLAGHATPRAMKRLSIARGSLLRCLRALGLTLELKAGDPEDPNGEVRGGVADYMRRLRSESKDEATDVA